MRPLFPEIHPYNDLFLEVDDTHELYVEECGNPDGIPVVFLHGGPGAGCEPWHRQFFDPEVYRIVLLDQRGSGRSRPHASLVNNTTEHLVSDIEQVREYLGIEKWMVFGGSWGSTLALVYAQAHPQRVSGLILRGIFLCRPSEIHWFYQEGASRIFPDYWESFIEHIPEDERGELVQAHHKRLIGDDEVARMASAKAWSIWEGRTSNLHQKKSVVEFFGSAHTALSLARIEAHFFVNDSFLGENQILDNMDSLTDIPGIIVHGRYDIVCPIESAWELHNAWPGSVLEIIPDAGHSASEVGITDALVRATIEMASTVGKRD